MVGGAVGSVHWAGRGYPRYAQVPVAGETAAAGQGRLAHCSARLYAALHKACSWRLPNDLSALSTPIGGAGRSPPAFSLYLRCCLQRICAVQQPRRRCAGASPEVRRAKLTGKYRPPARAALPATSPVRSDGPPDGAELTGKYRPRSARAHGISLHDDPKISNDLQRLTILNEDLPAHSASVSPDGRCRTCGTGLSGYLIGTGGIARNSFRVIITPHGVIQHRPEPETQ